MRNVEIKLTGIQNPGEVVINIDDKPVKFKKNQFASFICNYQTDNNKINIKIFRVLDVGGFVWFITQLFFFLISIFGIFDIHSKETCMVIDFESEINLENENKITLQLNQQKKDNNAVDIQTDLKHQETSNLYILNTKAKRTLKALKLTKIFLTIAIIITTIAVVVINF